MIKSVVNIEILKELITVEDTLLRMVSVLEERGSNLRQISDTCLSHNRHFNLNIYCNVDHTLLINDL